eukprot:SAG22_NODE_501_length_9710_cov_5.130267_4_plen_50_part_00
MALGCGSVVLQSTPIVVLPGMSLRFQSADITFRKEAYVQETTKEQLEFV